MNKNLQERAQDDTPSEEKAIPEPITDAWTGQLGSGWVE
jgi:hypothetical protein